LGQLAHGADPCGRHRCIRSCMYGARPTRRNCPDVCIWPYGRTIGQLPGFLAHKPACVPYFSGSRDPVRRGPSAFKGPMLSVSRRRRFCALISASCRSWVYQSNINGSM
jgi:hypothetical protein